MAILLHKTGKDLDNSDSIAPSDEYKGVQPAVLTEGRYYYNPYNWAWTVVPQIEIPAGKLGVRIRLYGENLPTGELIAFKESQKGIVPEVLLPSRYAINAQLVDPAANKVPAAVNNGYAEIIELHDPVTIPAGFKGVKTLVSAPLPETPNEVIVPKGTEVRGVQEETLEPGTYYLNPYVTQVSQVDCRSQRYNLQDIGFSTRDGFWVSLEGIIEFRVNPKEAAKVFVLYNEGKDNAATDAEAIQKMVSQKIIVPNARAYARLKGSSHSGKEFITGDTRATFQEDFQREMQNTCAAQGIEVIQALITNVKPPEKIAVPVRQRQIALQQEKQFTKEILQQAAEQDLAVQKAKVHAEAGRGRRGTGGRGGHRQRPNEARRGPHRRQQAAGRGPEEARGRQGPGGGHAGQGQGRGRRHPLPERGPGRRLAEVDRGLRRRRRGVRPLHAPEKDRARLQGDDGQYGKQHVDGCLQGIQDQQGGAAGQGGDQDSAPSQGGRWRGANRSAHNRPHRPRGGGTMIDSYSREISSPVAFFTRS